MEEDFFGEWKKIMMTTPDEEERLGAMLDAVKKQLSHEYMMIMIPIASVCAMEGVETYINFLYAIMAIGYSIRDDEDMDKPHKFSIKDFEDK